MRRDNFGLLVNPKNGDFIFADISRREVTIMRLDNVDAGSGYFERGSSGYGWTYDVTGYPRVHTPSGVSTRGGGYGTALYTALCYAAYLSDVEDMGQHGPPSAIDGRGISSGEPRSDYATAWWTRAKDVYGLASLVEGEITEDFDLNFDSGYKNVARDIAESELGARKVSISDYRIELSGSAEVPKEADAYPYRNAESANLVLAKLDRTSLKFNCQPIDNFSEVNTKAILAGSFGMLGETFRNDRTDRDAYESAELLLSLLKEHGASKSDVERCRLRFLTGVDDDPRTWEEIGDYGAFVPLRPNPPTTVTRTRLGPRRRGGRARVLRRTFRHPVIWAPSRLPPVAYAQHRANPSTLASARPAAVREAVERVHALRAELGWGVFMADRAAP